MDYQDPDWVAEKLGLEKNTVYRLLQDGTIPAVQLGRKWLISEARLGQWLAEETERQTAARQGAVSSANRLVRRLDQYSPGAREAIRAAHTLARRMNHLKLGADHLLIGLLRQSAGAAAKALSDSGVDVPPLCTAVEATMVPGDTVPPRRLGRTPEAKRIMRLAHREMQAAGETKVAEEHLLLGLAIGAEGQLAELCKQSGVDQERIRPVLAKHVDPVKSPARTGETQTKGPSNDSEH